MNLRNQNSEQDLIKKNSNNSLLFETENKKKNYLEHFFFSIILFFSFLTSFYNYLLFHTIAELFSIIIAGGIFVIAWNSRKNIDNSFFLVIGISFLFILFIDLIHTLAYGGMNLFIGYDSNLPTQLWITARYIQASSFLYASLVVNKKINPNRLILIYTIITLILIILIFNRIFPDCYIEGKGLTLFKIISEYIINGILFLSIIIMYKYRKIFNKKIFNIIILSIITTMISELAFTFYVNVYGISNLIGHIFKIIAFYLLYLAIIKIGLENPLNLLFRKLKKSEEKYYNLFESSPVGIAIKDFSGNLIAFNPKMCEITGYSSEDLKKINLKTIYNDEEERTKLIDLIKKETDIRNYEIKLIKKNGSIVYAFINAQIIDYEGKQALLMNYLDISQRKKAEQKLEQFVSTVSHELRTPITVLMMSTDYLKNQNNNISDELRDTLIDKISKNTFLLNDLIENILTLSKIDEKRLKMTWTEFQPSLIIKGVLDLMDPRLKVKNIVVQLDIDDDIKIYGDPKMIDQLFRILIDNAIKYSNENSKLQIKSERDFHRCLSNKDINGVLFEITDYGLGIHSNDISHIFNRFYRSERVRDIPGTGLGLSIAKELVLFHNGKIYVKSEYGKGSTFSVFLPIKS